MAVAGEIRTDGWAFAFILGISPCLEWLAWAQCTRFRGGIPAPGRARPRPVPGPIFVDSFQAGVRPVQSTTLAVYPARAGSPEVACRPSGALRHRPGKSVPPVLIAGPGLSTIWVLHPALTQPARKAVCACGSGWPESRSGASGYHGIRRVTGPCFMRSAGPSA